jgi:hypothetical protein
MSPIIIILSAAALSFIMVDVIHIYSWHKFFRRKPFTCNTCMAGWLTLLMVIISRNVAKFILEDIKVLCMMAWAMIISIFITKILNRL